MKKSKKSLKMKVFKNIIIPSFLASTAFISSNVNAEVPFTRQSYDFLKLNDVHGDVSATVSRMAGTDAGVKAISNEAVSPSDFRGGSPVSRPDCALPNNQDWSSVSLARRAMVECFEKKDVYTNIEKDLKHLIDITGSRSGYYTYNEPVKIQGDNRFFQVGVFLRANQNHDEARRVGITISPPASVKNIYAIYEQPVSAEPIGTEMLMPGAGQLKIYTMEGRVPEAGIDLVDTIKNDDFAAKTRSASSYNENNITLFDKSGALKAIRYLSERMDEYASEVVVFDYGNPISPILDTDPNDPMEVVDGKEVPTMPLVPKITITTPERIYQKNNCVDPSTVSYAQRNETKTAVFYQRDRYVMTGNTESLRQASLHNKSPFIRAADTSASISATESVPIANAVSGNSSKDFNNDGYIDFFEYNNVDKNATNEEDRFVWVSSEHANIHDYPDDFTVSNFENSISDPYGTYSNSPENLFPIGQNDPYNNISWSGYSEPVDVVDDSLENVTYVESTMVEDGYYSTRCRTEKVGESCTDTFDEDGNKTGENCSPIKKTVCYPGKYDRNAGGAWSYSGWVEPVYEEHQRTACVHNTQVDTFCQTYNCPKSSPAKDSLGYINDYNVEQYQEEEFYWDTGSWSGCDNNCGVGDETRSVICKSSKTGSQVSSANCSEPKPEESRPCTGDVSKCTFSWQTTNWSECSEPCDGGFKTRDVYCQAPDGSKVGASRCDAEAKPSERERCNSDTCVYEYKTSNWTSCVSNSQCASSGASRGWIGNQFSTLTGKHPEGFNGSNFICRTTSRSSCSGNKTGSITTTIIYGQQSRSVQCERTNDGKIVHIGNCGINQPKTHQQCVRSKSVRNNCRSSGGDSDGTGGGR